MNIEKLKVRNSYHNRKSLSIVSFISFQYSHVLYSIIYTYVTQVKYP